MFADASLETMCMAAFLRNQNDIENQLSFVIGKCRIAPIKQLSIPRLELQAALYAVPLRQLFSSDHGIRIEHFYHWTVSVTVLRLLHAANKKQTDFVGKSCCRNTGSVSN